MTTCRRCRAAYTPSKSTSALVLTYCGVLCETADLGFSFSALEHLELSGPRHEAARKRQTAVTLSDTSCELAA